MTRTRIYPHLQATTQSCLFGPWFATVGSETVEVRRGGLAWDYTTELLLATQATIDHEEIVRSTGIREIEQIGLVAMADCPATGRRFVDISPLSGEAKVDNVLSIPAGTVAKSLALHRLLILLEDREPSGYVAHRVGSRLLAEAKVSFIVEGSSSRFPTEAVSFSKLGYKNAPWRFELSYGDPSEDAFMGAARLLINIDHPAAAALTQSTHPQFRAMSKLMLADVLRTSVLKLLPEPDAISSTAAEGSVVSVVANMANIYLDLSLADAQDLVWKRPEEFEVRLKDRVEYLKDLA